jgi:galactokinase
VREANQIRALASETLGYPVEHPAHLNRAALDRLTGGDRPVLNPDLAARLRHIVSETERVESGMTALRGADWPEFGRLMTESGRSSATDYDVSHPRVEELVREILAVDGVLGARMMGGGGGGTALTLLRKDRIPALERALRAGYYRRYGLEARPGVIQPCAFAGPAQVVTDLGSG